MPDAEAPRRSAVLESAERGLDSVRRHLAHEQAKASAERAQREATARRNTEYLTATSTQESAPT